jgi:hypothetical protein
VHNKEKVGFGSHNGAREKGVSACIADGANRCAAVHLVDTARLYRLALEKHEPAARYNAVAEEGAALLEIAEVIGAGLKVPVVSISPEDAKTQFGWLAMFAGMDKSSWIVWTRQQLGW